MKRDIHPKYVECVVKCACGNEFVTRSTKPSMNLEICSACHPFFTGAQKFVDTAGRVERFQKKYEATKGKTVVRAKKKAKKAEDKDKAFRKILSTAPTKKKALKEKAKVKENKENKEK